MLIQNDLANAENCVVVLRDERKDFGRTQGATEVPQFLKNTIAVLQNNPETQGTNSSVARAFGISSQEVSLIKRARLPDSKDEFGRDVQNPDSQTNREIKSAVATNLESARETAAARLLDCLKSVTPERISLLPKLTDTMMVANGLAKIIESTSPKTDLGRDADARFVFIVPENRKVVRDYEVVEVEQTLD